MKILYISSYHPTLEHNHAELFNNLGLDWFSTGIYLNDSPQSIKQYLKIRPYIKPPLVSMYKQEFLTNNPKYFQSFTGLNSPTVKLDKDFIKNFDIVFSCNPSILLNHWDDFKNLPVILFTCGNTHSIELKLTPLVNDGLKIVRGSSTELKIKNCNKSIVIPCFIDEEFYSNWTGICNYVLSFQSHLKERRNTLPVKTYFQVTKEINTRIYGTYANNQKDPAVISTLSYNEQLNKYRECSAYFSISNGVAPITYNFMEALVTGAPVVCFGPKIGGSTMVKKGLPSIYDQCNIIQNEVDGFYSDDVSTLKQYLNLLLKDKTASREIGANGRKTGINLFGKQTVVNQWRTLFNNL